MYKRLASIVILAVVVFTMIAVPAFAATTETSKVTATLNGGTGYGIDTLGDFGFSAYTLNGAAQSLTNQTVSGADQVLQVKDDRGTGGGWTLSAQCTTLQIDAAPAKAFAKSSITMPQLSIAKVDAGSSALPTCNAAAKVDVASAVVFVSAAANQGMGTYNVTVPWAGWGLDISADEYAGSYTSTLTITMAVL